jgi:O-antigen/teichoic acid export membrane protein
VSDATEAPRKPSHIVALAKQTIVYGISGVALQAIGVLTLPVFARVFTRAEYGKLELATVLSAVTLTVVDAGFASAAQRSFYDYSADQGAARRTVILTALVFTSGLGLIAALALFFAREPIARSFFGHSSDSALVAIVAVSIPFVNTAAFLRETMRLRFRAWHYVASSLLASVVAAGLGIVAVVVFDLSLRGVFVGAIAGNLLAVLYGALVVREDIGRYFSTSELLTMLRYGAPLVPAAVAMWALVLIDRVMLNALGNLREVGEYAVANRLANVLLLGVTGFALAFGPHIFALYAEDRDLERAVRVQALRYLVVGLSFAGLALALFAREIISVAAPAFGRAYEAVGLLVLSIVVFGISSVVIAGISYARRTDLMAVIAIVGAAVNVGLNFALIPTYGMMGAALANAVAYVVLAVLQFVVAQRLYPTAYEVRKLLITIGLATGLGAAGVVRFHSLAVALPVKVIVLAIFPVLLWAARVIVAEELDRLRQIASALRHFRAARA